MSETTPLAPCPFCGAPAHGYAIEPHSHSPSLMRLIPELPDHPGSYVIEGQCACGSGLIGAYETEVVARWNRRAPQPSPASQVDTTDVVDVPDQCPYFGPSPHRDVWLAGWYAASAAQEGKSHDN